MIASIFAVSFLAQSAEARPVALDPPPPPPMVERVTVVESAKSPEPRPNRPVMPKGDPANWIRSFDYPAAAREEGRTGETRVRVSVTRWGGVADCQIYGSSGHPDLDAATCDLLAERARFYPALDQECGRSLRNGATVSNGAIRYR